MIRIGPFVIHITASGKLAIHHDSGEGGEFNMERFVAHIQEFFNREF
jgi:hypothetical protein